MVEGPVHDPAEAVLDRSAASEKCFATCPRIEPRRGLHRARIATLDLLVGQARVEVVADAISEPVQVDINEKRVPVRQYSVEAHREQVGQSRPFEPSLVDRRSQERHSERQGRFDPLVERLRLCIGRLQQVLALPPAPEMPEVNLGRRFVVRLPDQRSDRGADLDAHAIALG